MNESEHVVFGAGLIGGFLAGCLMHTGFSTSMVARERTREAMSNGLLISDYSGNQSKLPPPRFLDQHKPDNSSIDYIWLTVKCTSIDNIREDLSAYVGESTVIICCQNGFGSDKIIADAFPNNAVLCGIFGSNVAEPEPGHLLRSTEGKFVVELPSSEDLDLREKISDIVTQLNSELMEVYASEDIEAEQWAKLQLNMTNSVNALANIPIKQMLENHQFRCVIARLMKELIAVTDAKGIRLPKLTILPPHWIPKMLELSDFWFKLLGQKMIDIDPTATTSMWWDLHNNRKTEIAYLNGALVNAAHENQIACPANTAVVELIRQAELADEHTGISPLQLLELTEA